MSQSAGKFAGVKFTHASDWLSKIFYCLDGSERDIGLPNMEPQLLTGSMPLNTS